MKVSVLVITMAMVCLAFAMLYQTHTLRAQDARYSAQVASLQTQLEQEQERSEDLEESKAYVQTRQYIEEMAREKLGLVNPDETVVKAK